MLELIALLCLAAAIVLLVILSIIDLKILILPDELNLALAITGVVFHLCTAHYFLSWGDMAMGAIIGGGMLLTIRFFANRHYGRDSLGLGDVKLLAAAGVWLGLEGVLFAVTAGAFAGLLHGIAYAGWIAAKTGTRFTIRDLSIPAGPGFAVGIVLTGAFMFGPYAYEVVDVFLAR